MTLRVPRRPGASLSTTPMTPGRLRDRLADRGCETVTPPTPIHKYPHTYDKVAYWVRNLVERVLYRLKGFRRIATRHDKPADIFLAGLSWPWWFGGLIGSGF